MPGWGTTVADLLFPRDCAGCLAPLTPGHPSALCRQCWEDIVMPSPLCCRCGIPIHPPLATCATCAAAPPRYRAARALGLYLADAEQLNPLARAIRALKYRGHRAVARSLGRAMANRLALPAGALVIPVPLHRSRLRERGYDQAVLLAAAVAGAAGLELAPRGLVRQRPTSPQAMLDATARRRNLAGAFVATARYHGRAIVLVDDVLTTGATADACARALDTAGAREVVVATVGRTP